MNASQHLTVMSHGSYEGDVDGHVLSDELLHSTAVVSSHRPTGLYYITALKRIFCMQ